MNNLRSRSTVRTLPLLAMCALAGTVGVVWAPGALAQPATAKSGLSKADPRLDGSASYPISRFLIQYDNDNPEQPAIGELLNLPVAVGVLDDGYTYPRPGIPQARITVGEAFGESGRKFYPAGVRAVTEAIAKELTTNRKLAGVYVIVNPDDVNPQTGEDTRKGTDLRLVVFTGQITKPPVLISQDPELPPEERTNPERLERLRTGSPLSAGNLIHRDQLDDYILRLNRHPGRRVDAALVPSSEKVGDVELQYLVAESKPWTIYGQVSNTGTKSTDEWRERVGYVNNELTGADDIFRIDALTASFNGTDAVLGSYERPLAENLKFRIYGNWSRFKASDLGFGNETFKGESYGLGGELTTSVYQKGDYFLDLVGGARWDYVRINNELIASNAHENFLSPYIGVRAEKKREDSESIGDVTVEYMNKNFTGVNAANLNGLGRLYADTSWVLIKYDLSHSFYIEPLLSPRAYKEKDEQIRNATLAHEIAVSVHGQYAFNKRLIPNFEGVAGGFYSVRGYKESAVAGDNVIVGSAEYRFHIPRILTTTGPDGKRAYYDPNQTALFGKPFRYGPDRAWGRTDWDVILRGFLDVARVENSKREPFEENSTLAGAGVGIEFDLLQNVQIRADLGFALDGAGPVNDRTKSGDTRLHFSATFLY